MQKNTFLTIIGIFFLLGTIPVHGITVAPKITDREIVEKLAILETGQQNIDKRFDAVAKQLDAVDKRFEAIDKRFESLRNDFNMRMEQQFNLILWLGGVLVTIIVGGMGFLYSQNLQMLKRFEKTVDEKQVREIIREDQNVLNIRNIQYALKEYAQNDEDLDVILKRHRVA